MNRTARREEIAAALRRHNCTKGAFALLLNVHNTRLASWLSGKGKMSDDKRREMLSAIEFFDALAAEIYPIPVDFSNVEAIRPKWDEWRKKGAAA